MSFTFRNTGPAACSITDIYMEDGPILGLAQMYWLAPAGKTIPYSEFKEYVKNGAVSEVFVGDTAVRGSLKNPIQNGTRQTREFITNRVEDSKLTEELEAREPRTRLLHERPLVERRMDAPDVAGQSPHERGREELLDRAHLHADDEHFVQETSTELSIGIQSGVQVLVPAQV